MGFVRPADTALAVVPRTLYAVCLGHGLSPEWLYRRWGIRPGGYTDADSFVPYAECLALWDALEASRPSLARTPDRQLRLRPVGVEVGELVGSSDFGIVGLASAQAGTLGEALATFCRLQHVIDPTFALQVEVESELVALNVQADKRLVLRQHPLEAALVTVQRTAERLVQRRLPNSRVEFAHAPRGSAACYEHVFGCRAEHTDRYRLHWEKGVLDLKLASARPELLGYLTREAEIVARQRAEPELSASEQTKRWISAHRGSIAEVLSSEPSRSGSRADPNASASLMRQAARSMGRSVRTLQRQLAEEGETFRRLLEQILCARARVLLEVQSRTVAEVAAALGYREQRSFQRAFKRWSGCTPSEYRAAHPGSPVNRMAQSDP